MSMEKERSKVVLLQSESRDGDSFTEVLALEEVPTSYVVNINLIRDFRSDVIETLVQQVFDVLYAFGSSRANEWDSEFVLFVSTLCDRANRCWRIENQVTFGDLVLGDVPSVEEDPFIFTRKPHWDHSTEVLED